MGSINTPIPSKIEKLYHEEVELDDIRYFEKSKCLEDEHGIEVRV